jgi:DNA-binding transcriptional MerR regulator
MGPDAQQRGQLTAVPDVVAVAPRLSVAAVARRLGVAPATLRTWDRRYGLGPSEHEAGAHRRYTPRDLDRLAAMRRLTLEGVPPAEAARAVLGQPLVDPPSAPSAAMPGPDGHIATALHIRPGGPGGRVLALPGADASVRGLGRAAMALDARAVTNGLRDQITAHGVLHTWDHVLRPLLVAVGDRWAATGEGVEVEHLLAECAADVLREVAARPEELPGRRPVLLACAPDERHALPLHALAAGLGERGVATRTLGPAMPAQALQAAVLRTGPAVLFLWSQLPGSADPQVLEDLPVTRPATAVVVGGPGWSGAVLPRRVTVAADLPHALTLVDAALGG